MKTPLPHIDPDTTVWHLVQDHFTVARQGTKLFPAAVKMLAGGLHGYKGGRDWAPLLQHHPRTNAVAQADRGW